MKTRIHRRALAFAIYMMPWLVASCSSDKNPPPSPTIEIRAETPRELPRIPYVVDDATIEELRNDFSWASTAPLDELDPDGYPSLHYAMLYLESSEQVNTLEELSLHYETWPLFVEELSLEADAVGEFAPGSGTEASIVFALLPAEVYNILREAGLEGETSFAAVILRDPPASVPTHPSGALTYDWLANEGFQWRPQDEAPAEGAMGRKTQPLGRFVRRVVEAARKATQRIRTVIGALSEAVNDERTVFVRVNVRNSDVEFGDERLISAWSGEPIQLTGAEVSVGSGRLVSLNRATLNEQGYARMTIPANHDRIRVRLRLANDAADLREIYLTKEPLLFSGRISGVGAVDITINTTNRDLNVLAQMTDTLAFMTERVGVPRFRPANVQAGRIASIAPNALAPCFSKFSDRNIRLDGFGGASLVSALSRIDNVDIIMPDDTKASRLVATHEYGHYVMCALMAREDGADFSRAWGAVIEDSLLQNMGGSGIIAEGWADFISFQVAGGTNYFSFGSDRGEFFDGGFFCDAEADAGVLPCMETNVGGGTPGEAAVALDRQDSIARIATYLHDVFDGGRGTGLANDGLWRFDGEVPRVSNQANHAVDENVALPGGAVWEIIQSWSVSYDSLTYNAFESSIVDVMLDNDVSVLDACTLVALHQPDGTCASNFPASSFADLDLPAPVDLSAEVRQLTSDAQPNAVVGWRHPHAFPVRTWVSCSGAEYDAFLQLEAGINVAKFESLPFDQPIECELYALTTESETATIAFHTLPEPVAAVTGLPRSGGVELGWSETEASGFIVQQVAPESREELRTETNAATIRGLTPGVDYTFEIVSVDATGRPAAFPSPRVTVTAGEVTEFYVSSRSGDDANEGGETGPKQTLAGALAAAPTDEPVTIFLESGNHTAETVRVIAQEITLQGGMSFDGSTWSDSLEPTVLTVTPTRDYQLSWLDGFNGVHQRRGVPSVELSFAQVTLRDLTVASTVDAAANECGVGVALRGGQLELENVVLQSIGSGPCHVGVHATSTAGSLSGNTLRIRSSEIVSWNNPSGGSSNFEMAGVLATGLDELLVVESVVSATKNDAGMTADRVYGLYGENLDNVRVQRSTITVSDDAVAANVSSGAHLLVTTEAFFDNSVVWAARGANEVLGLYAAAHTASDSPIVRLLNNTVVAGDAFVTPAVPVARGERAAAVAIAGTVSQLDLQNNLLVFADPGDWTVFPSTLNVTDWVPTQSGSRFVSNVYSHPGPASVLSAGGVKVLCTDNGEFSVRASSESETNDSANYLCQAGGTAEVRGNVALGNAFGEGAASERRAVALNADGTVSVDDTGEGTKTILRTFSEALPSNVASQADRDRGANPRPADPGIGAWLVP